MLGQILEIEKCGEKSDDAQKSQQYIYWSSAYYKSHRRQTQKFPKNGPEIGLKVKWKLINNIFEIIFSAFFDYFRQVTKTNSWVTWCFLGNLSKFWPFKTNFRTIFAWFLTNFDHFWVQNWLILKIPFLENNGFSEIGKKWKQIRGFRDWSVRKESEQIPWKKCYHFWINLGLSPQNSPLTVFGWMQMLYDLMLIFCSNCSVPWKFSSVGGFSYADDQ